jgi:hypothetical protein
VSGRCLGGASGAARRRPRWRRRALVRSCCEFAGSGREINLPVAVPRSGEIGPPGVVGPRGCRSGRPRRRPAGSSVGHSCGRHASRSGVVGEGDSVSRPLSLGCACMYMLGVRHRTGRSAPGIAATAGRQATSEAEPTGRSRIPARRDVVSGSPRGVEPVHRCRHALGGTGGRRRHRCRHAASRAAPASHPATAPCSTARCACTSQRVAGRRTRRSTRPTLSAGPLPTARVKYA